MVEGRINLKWQLRFSGIVLSTDRGMITMEARVTDAAAIPVLLELLTFDGQQRRRLFRDVHVLGKDPKILKRDYGEVITARHFNSLLDSVNSTISSLKELKKDNIATKEQKIKSAESWLKEKIKKCASLSSTIKALTSYREQKRQAAKANKRLKIPSSLRCHSLPDLTSERAQLQARIHHKKRYVISAKRRLLALQSRTDLSVCFGSKALFRKQFHLAENGYENHAEWAEDFAFARSSSTKFLGSKDESAGNQTAQYDLATQTLKLRLPKTAAFAGFPQDRLTISGITFPERYLPHLAAALAPPQPDGKKPGKVTSAIQVRFVKRKKCGGKETAVYVQLTCEAKAAPVTTSKDRGAIGIDLNADHLAICETDRFGNFVRAESLAFNFKDLSTDQVTAVLGDYVAAAVGMAQTAGKPVVIEKLDFRTKKCTLREQGPGYAHMLSQFAYSKFHDMMLSRSSAEGVELIRVNPAYSSVIGAFKYFGLDISTHEKAALALARRALGFSERTKAFHGTRRPPVRMALADETKPGANGPEGKLRRRVRHVWSHWARSARAIRQSLVRGSRRTPRVSVDFGESYRNHPQVAKAAGVMSLSEARMRRDHHSSDSSGSGEAARPTAEPKPLDVTFEQVCVGI